MQRRWRLGTWGLGQAPHLLGSHTVPLSYPRQCEEGAEQRAAAAGNASCRPQLGRHQRVRKTRCARQVGGGGGGGGSIESPATQGPLLRTLRTTTLLISIVNGAGACALSPLTAGLAHRPGALPLQTTRCNESWRSAGTMMAQAAGCRQAAILFPPTRCAAPGALQARHQVSAATCLSAGSSSAPRSGSGSRRRQCRAAAEGAATGSAVAAADAAPSSGSSSVPQSDVWELDFCSRPILDERGKKVRGVPRACCQASALQVKPPLPPTCFPPCSRLCPARGAHPELGPAASGPQCTAPCALYNRTRACVHRVLSCLPPPGPCWQVWELVICDPERSFEYAQYYPNNKINSGEVGAGWIAASGGRPAFLVVGASPIDNDPQQQGSWLLLGRGCGWDHALHRVMCWRLGCRPCCACGCYVCCA